MIWKKKKKASQQSKYKKEIRTSSTVNGKLEIQENFLNLIKDIYKNPAATIMLNGERQNAFI